MGKAKIIVNPAAGAGKTGRLWPRVREFLASTGLDFDFDISGAPGQPVELAAISAREGYDLVVAVGGDGTIGEVVSGLYRAGALDRVSLGIVSTGTGGDYIRTLGLSRDYREACRAAASGDRFSVDAGVIESFAKSGRPSRVFVNIAGAGIDAEIVRVTTRRFKMLGNPASYLAGLLATLLSYRNRRIAVTVDGRREVMKACVVLLGNGRYGGGGMLAVPCAEPADGLFDVVIIGDLSKPDLLWSLPRVYRGTHLDHPKVVFKRGVDVVLEPLEAMAMQADGDLLPEGPARFRVLPGALRIAGKPNRQPVPGRCPDQ